MKNRKIRGKLLAGFLSLAFLTAVVGGMGIAGLSRLNNNQAYLYDESLHGIYYATKLESLLHEQRVAYRGMILNAGDSQAIQQSYEGLQEHMSEFESLLQAYEDELEYDPQLVELQRAYHDEYLPMLNNLVDVIFEGNTQRSVDTMLEMTDTVQRCNSLADGMVQANMERARITEERDSATAARRTWLMAGLSLFAVAGGIALGFYIAGSISRPIHKLVDAAKKMSLGDMEIDADSGTNDEIAELAEAFKEMAHSFHQQARVLASIAQGDYTGEIKMRSPKDEVNQAIAQILDHNNEVMSEIMVAADQVSTGAQQIAQGAQDLASGSSEQAATVEEFSAAMEESLEQTESNAKAASDALEVTSRTGELVDQSTEAMNRMLVAMQSIDESSRSITKVIKVIEDIAFQTNILALNAAVEAARAGQHGRGFAVVADEVRNLASLSSSAAQETASLIEGSSQRVEEGNKIVEATSTSLHAMADGAKESLRLIQEIARASDEQARSIAQVNQGINQISQVVQANSATAEESAASAQEMSAQAVLLGEIVSRFRIKGAVGRELRPADRGETLDFPLDFGMPSGIESGFALSADDKY